MKKLLLLSAVLFCAFYAQSQTINDSAVLRTNINTYIVPNSSITASKLNSILNGLQNVSAKKMDSVWVVADTLFYKKNGQTKYVMLPDSTCADPAYGLFTGALRDQTDLADSLDTKASTVADITALLAFVRFNNKSVIVRDATRGGQFNYSASGTDNSVTVFPAAGGGHWVRDISQAQGWHVKWFGAVGDGTTDETTLLQGIIDAAIAAGVRHIIFDPGTYMINRLNFYDIPDNFVLEGIGGATLKKTVGTSDAVLVFAAQTQDIRNVTITNLVMDGNAAAQTTKAAGSASFPYPNTNLFGTTAVVYSAGEFPTGTALYFSEDYTNHFYITHATCNNLTLKNWGKSGIYGTARRLSINNLSASKIMLHPVAIPAYDRTNDPAGYRIMNVDINGLNADSSGTAFDLSAGTKDDLKFYGECNISNVHGYKLWLNTKISGAWRGNITNMEFNDCGLNPAGTFVAGVSNNKYFAPFKMENTVYRGITIGSITTYKQQYAIKLVSAAVGSLYVNDATCNGVELTDCFVNNVKFSNDDSAQNISLAYLVNTTINNLYVKNVAYDYSTNTLGASIAARSNYPIYMVSSAINNAVFDAYSTQQGTFGLLYNNTIRNLKCYTSSILGKQNTTAAATTLTSTGVNVFDNCNFLDSCQIGNTTYGGTYFRQGVAGSYYRIYNTTGVGRFDDEMGTHYNSTATNSTGIKTDGNLNTWFDPTISNYRWNTALPSSLTDGTPVAHAYEGTGSPEGVVTAVKGSTYKNLSGGAATTFYIKETGTGNTGWVVPNLITLGTSGLGPNFTSGVLNLPIATWTVTGLLDTTNQVWKGIKTFGTGSIVVGTDTIASASATFKISSSSPNFAGISSQMASTNKFRFGYNGSDEVELRLANSAGTYGSSVPIIITRSNGNVGITGAIGGTRSSNLQVDQTTACYGTIDVTAADGTVTGTGTQFLNTFKVGDGITANSETHTITAIASNTSLTTDVWTATATGVAYTTTGGTRFQVRGSGLVGIGSSTPTDYLDLPASTVNFASLRMRSGITPTTFRDGMFWYDGTHFYMRIGSTSYQIDQQVSSSPTISSFVNATHTHTNAAGGGTLAEAALALTDITTNNASTSAHGFAPKYPNDATKYLDGTGAYSIPTGTGVSLSANNVWTANGALSSPAANYNGTWIITGGTGTTTKPVFLIEPSGTTSTAWSTVGTGIGANAASGFAGNLIDLQVAAVSKFSVLGSGNLTAAGTISAGSAFRSNGGITPVNAQGFQIGYTSATTHNTASLFLVTMGSGSITPTSGSGGGVLINPTYNEASGTAANTDLKINRTETALGSGAQLLFDAQVAGTSYFNIDNKGKITQSATITAGGTTGAQTINKPAGSVNFAAAATTLVVTNSLVSTSSLVMVTVYGTDATATSARVTLASGSFTITLNAAATAETKVGFWVIN